MSFFLQIKSLKSYLHNLHTRMYKYYTKTKPITSSAYSKINKFTFLPNETYYIERTFTRKTSSEHRSKLWWAFSTKLSALDERKTSSLLFSHPACSMAVERVPLFLLSSWGSVENKGQTEWSMGKPFDEWLAVKRPCWRTNLRDGSFVPSPLSLWSNVVISNCKTTINRY